MTISKKDPLNNPMLSTILKMAPNSEEVKLFNLFLEAYRTNNWAFLEKMAPMKDKANKIPNTAIEAFSKSQGQDMVNIIDKFTVGLNEAYLYQLVYKLNKKQTDKKAIASLPILTDSPEELLQAFIASQSPLLPNGKRDSEVGKKNLKELISKLNEALGD